MSTSSSRPLAGMRILAFVPRLWPTFGAGTQRTTAFVVGFMRAGADVTALVPSSGEPTSGRPPELTALKLTLVRDPLRRIPWQLFHLGSIVGLDDRLSLAHRNALKSLPGRPQFDLVFASGAPFSAVSAAAKAASRLRIPLAVDLRDEWSANPFQQRLGPIHRRAERRREAAALSGAALVTAPIPEILDQLAVPNTGQRRVIAHGCHASAIRAAIGPVRALGSDDRLVLVYAGTRYGSLNEEPFVAAYGRAPAPPPVELRLIGSDRPVRASLPDGLTVQVRGPIPHDELLQEYDRAHALLNFVPAEWGPAIVRSKFDEYKATGRPLLAFAPRDGRLYSATASTPGGHSADINSPSELSAALWDIRAEVEGRQQFADARAVRDWVDVGQDAALALADVVARL